eukprot:scaffold18968_cov114-Isochrysis_galbana.AAC.3
MLHAARLSLAATPDMQLPLNHVAHVDADPRAAPIQLGGGQEGEDGPSRSIYDVTSPPIVKDVDSDEEDPPVDCNSNPVNSSPIILDLDGRSHSQSNSQIVASVKRGDDSRSEDTALTHHRLRVSWDNIESGKVRGPTDRRGLGFSGPPGPPRDGKTPWVLSIGGSVMIALHVTKTSTLPKHVATRQGRHKEAGKGTYTSCSEGGGLSRGGLPTPLSGA